MFQYDLNVIISTGGSRKATFWAQQKMLWSEFVSKLSNPQRTSESLAEYKSWTKSKQDELKDVGGFVGGTLKDGRRKNDFAGERYLITLDADQIAPGSTQTVINRVSGLGCAYAIYSTRKHEEAAPRLRIVLPISRPVSPDEYEAISRKIASLIGIEIFDPTTFEAVRLMYWPSCSADSSYIFTYEDKPFLSADGVLGMYDDWKDVTQWPQVPGAERIRDRSAKRQGDPLSKQGIVGAFCRTYTIEEAMAEFLPGVYEPAGEGRYTYTGGSTVGGVVLYDDKFIYSHHATDPCSGKLCNAFDMVRLHLFGADDAESMADTPTHKLPSYEAMCNMAGERSEIKHLLLEERHEKAVQAFGGDGTAKNLDHDKNWVDKLTYNASTNRPVSSPYNMKLIIENDENIAGKFYLDEFASRIYVTGRPPWDDNYRGRRQWDDSDDAGLRNYLSDYYGISGKEKISDALTEVIQKRKCHPIRDYLSALQWDGIRRVDTLLTDYLGADDTAYTRAAIRKTLVAAVARVFVPGIKFDCMIILAGPQGIGKSTFWNRLGLDWYSDSLNTFDGKEAAELLQGYWIIEVGELAGLNKAEMNTIKGFLSKQEDIYRAPYGRRTAVYKRGCVIVGTTNDVEFLRDKTGNRRFWPVDLGKQPHTRSVFYDLTPQEVDQIWAEAVELFRKNEPLFMNENVEEMAKQAQAAHEESNPKEGMILNFLDELVPDDWNEMNADARMTFYMNSFGNKERCTQKKDRVCAVEIWVECFRQDKGRMKNSDAIEINRILRRIPGWTETGPRATRAYGKQRLFVRE